MQKSDTDPALLDLRLLRFLRLLLMTGSVSKTALHLGISQPAASRILARVRDLIGDPILIRTQAGYQLTDHALSLRGPVESAIHAVAAVFAPSDFDPASSRFRYRIAATDYGVASVVGPVMESLLTAGPRLRVEVSPLVPSSFDDLEKGKIDLMLYIDVKGRDDLLVQKLFDETYVILFRKGHPLERVAKRKRDLTQRDIAPFRQIEVSYPGRTEQQVDRILRKEDGNPAAVFHQPFFTAFPYLIGTSDTLAAVPKRLGDRVCQLGDFTSAPFRVDEGFPYYLVRHERTRHNKAIAWFVQQAKNVVG